MALVLVNLRTTFLRAEIHHLDVALIHRTDSRLNRYTIVPRVPDTPPGTDLTEFLRVAQFDNVPNESWYSYVFRLYLIRDSRIVLRSASFNTGSPDCRGAWFWRRCTGPFVNANVIISG